MALGLAARSSAGVSICTFVLVKQGNIGFTGVEEGEEEGVRRP